MTIVRVATTNSAKVQAVHAAFQIYFEDVKVETVKVNSGVPEQPIDDLVVLGAENRLNELKALSQETDYDYLVSCEGGLISKLAYVFNVQVVLIENKEGKRGIGLSQGYEIPEKYIQKAISTSVADMFDEVFNGEGGIRKLTHGFFTRESLIKDGTIMALTRMINGEIW